LKAMSDNYSRKNVWILREKTKVISW
jgi:hypothetical protein